MRVTKETHLGRVLRHAPARAIFGQLIPHLADSPFLEMMRSVPIGALEQHLGADPSAIDRLIEALPDIPEITERDRPVTPSTTYEADTVSQASAACTSPAATPLWAIHEIVLSGPSHGNPYVDVQLDATFTHGDRTLTVPGFYDGDGTYRIRFMPDAEGAWTFATVSTARSLDGISGTLTCTAAVPGTHGPVRVANTHHFAYADGTPFRPVGTTLYAWTHQPEAVEQRTLAALTTGPFNKVRMCVFPKWYPHNQVEPRWHGYERKADGTFDLQRFNPEFYRHLEERLHQMAALGIEADLILFHPYDKWGYCDMPASADDRYLRYVIARLSAFANVWWSLANEYDFVYDKDDSDWHRIGELIHALDPHDHLIGVHNGLRVWDHSISWVTHSSIQSQEHAIQPESSDAMRTRWGKPVMIDECCYEGDIEFGFGNLTGEEMTRRFWDATVRGGYCTHGECFIHPTDELWWGKGGDLHGTSPERIAFLRSIIDSAPWPLDPVETRRGYATVGNGDSYFLSYNRDRQPARRTVEGPTGASFRVEVIDTWNMTIDDIGVHTVGAEITIPSRPYLALRATRPGG